MMLYHATTEKKAKLYKQTGYIRKPVKGFNTLMAAMAWAIKVNRTVIYEIETHSPILLPDHHNKWGEAYWIDDNISIDIIKCVYSKKDA